ncbi:MAG: 6-carboxytetrahydropterin synthase [Acidobacteriia bacterium]|nr:6-carboxytetrahydropterin synthase [Terriglobia bacterium]
MFRVTRQYRFAASHRLHAAGLSEEQNRVLYGKCNNPYGHGHNYVVDVSACGPTDERTGRVLDIRLLDQLVARQVLGPFEHRNLNAEVECFESVVPTSENLAAEICRRLKKNWSTAFPGEWPKLEKIRIAETTRNIFEIRTDEIE